jgi:electron transfer flavoprotein beta subunit
MDTVVLLKRVPDTAARIAVGSDGTRIDPSGVEWILSPYDEMALERAIQLRESAGGRVTALALGPPEAVKELRTALAMGADEAVLLVDEAPERDAAGTAAALVTALRGIPHDLILAGWKAVDTDDAAVPHYVAAALDMPCLCFAVELDVEDGRAVVHREMEGAEVIVSAPLPCLVTAQKGLAEPRYTSLKGIMMAKKKPLDTRPAEAVEPKVRTVAMALPAARAEGRIVGEGAAAVPELIRALSDEQKIL